MKKTVSIVIISILGLIVLLQLSGLLLVKLGMRAFYIQSDGQGILLDEPFAGINPIAVTDIQRIIFHLKERGIGVLITDHNVRETLRITDRAYIVTDGAIFRDGTPAALAADEEVRRIYLGTDSGWTRI